LNSGNCAIVAPNADFDVSSDTICKGEMLVLTDTSTGNITNYAWNFGSGASMSSSNTKGPHSISFSTGGTKTISLTITTINGNLVKNKNVFVINDFEMFPRFSWKANEKGLLTFTNTSNNPILSKWYFGDGDSSSIQSPIHQYSTGGTYNVTLKAINDCNSKDTIIPIEFAWLNFYSNKNSACIGEEVMVFDSSDNNVATWAWSFPGAIPSTATGKGPHSIRYQSSGNKSVSLNIVTGGSNNQSYTRSNLINVGADTFTQANFIYGYYGKNIVGFDNKSSGSNMQYKWYFGDGDSSTEKNPIHTYSNANTQTVRLVVSGDCFNDDTTIVLRNFTDILAVNNANLCTIYPNPSDKELYIESKIPGKIQIEIFNLNGKSILKSNIQSNEKIDLSAISSGTFLIKLDFENGLIDRQILIKN
jgi:PKD repeat protein